MGGDTMSHADVLSMINRIFNTTTILNFGALFTDVTPNFVKPAEPDIGDDITIRFRTARNNADGVHLVMGDVHYPMKVVENNSIFDL